MNKLGTFFSGCLTGMVALVLVVAAITYIDSYFYNAPAFYTKLESSVSPNGKKHAHLFTNKNLRNSLAPYSGVSLSRGMQLDRDYTAEIFTIGPPEALASMEMVWRDNETLELRYRVDAKAKSRIHYGSPPANLVRHVIFTELQDAQPTEAIP